jgi:hypothetical protein
MKFTHKKNGKYVIPYLQQGVYKFPGLLKRKKLPGTGKRPWPFLPISEQSDHITY